MQRCQARLIWSLVVILMPADPNSEERRAQCSGRFERWPDQRYVRCTLPAGHMGWHAVTDETRANPFAEVSGG